MGGALEGSRLEAVPVEAPKLEDELEEGSRLEGLEGQSAELVEA